MVQQKLDRRQFVLLIAGAVAGLLLIGMLLLSWLSPGAEANDPDASIAPAPSPSPTEVVQDPDAGAPIGNPDASGAPPSSMYENDYTGDEGYTPLPEGFDPNTSGTANTIYDELWAAETMQRLTCELSTKRTASPEAIAPMRALYEDLALAPYGSAQYMRTEMDRWISFFENNEGERVPATMQDELVGSCQYTEGDSHGEGVHDHSGE